MVLKSLFGNNIRSIILCKKILLDHSEIGSESRDEGRRKRRERKWMEKEFKMSCVHEAGLHEEYIHCVLQKYTNKMNK